MPPMYLIIDLVHWEYIYISKSFHGITAYSNSLIRFFHHHYYYINFSFRVKVDTNSSVLDSFLLLKQINNEILLNKKSYI